MPDSIVIPTAGEHAALAGVATLAVGSAKVPHLPVMPELIAAPNEDAVVAAVAARTAELETFAARLEVEGLAPMAATARRALRAGRWNADLMSLLEWIYGATFKTAGRATMSFAPWYVDATASCPEAAPRRASRGCTYVRLTPTDHQHAAHANQRIYERLIGALNAAAASGGELAGAAALIHDVVSVAACGDSPAPRFACPSDLKCLLKADYKLGPAGELVLIDISAGLVGLHFDDILLDALPAEAGVPTVRVAPRMLDVAWRCFSAARGRTPQTAAVLVLDEEMYSQWAAADLDGLRAQMGARLSANAGAVPVLTLAGLEAFADAAPGAVPDTLGAPWAGVPELLLVYSCRVGELVRPATYAWLRRLGVVIVDERHHGLAAAKELSTPEILGERLSAGVRMPETFVFDPMGAGGFPCPQSEEDIVELAWDLAEKRGWEVLAIKMGKVRRAQGAGDFPTAFIYPVTPLGQRLALRGLRRVWGQVEAAAGRPCLTVTQVEAGGGYQCAPGKRYDIEVRTYALPVLRG